MRTPEEVRRARALISLTRDFMLEEGKEGGAVLTFEFQAGALAALEWMTRSSEGELFGDYLASLEGMHQSLIGGQP